MFCIYDTENTLWSKSNNFSERKVFNKFSSAKIHYFVNLSQKSYTAYKYFIFLRIRG